MKWLEKEKEQIISLLKEGKNYSEIAEVTPNRTTKAIKEKLNELGYKYDDFKPSLTEIVVCLNCGVGFVTYKSEDRKYCSHSCSAKGTNPTRKGEKRNFSEEALENIRKANSKKRTNHPRLCIGCSELTLNIKYCSKNCKDNDEHYKKQRSLDQTQRLSLFPDKHPNKTCAGIKESYPEKTCREFLQACGLIKDKDFIQQYKVDKYFIDFYFPDINIGIEIDGERWHDLNSEKEIKRQIEIEKSIILKRFWAKPLIKKQHEIELKEICDRIKNVMYA